MKDFFIGVRNATASFFSWLVIVWILFYSISGKQSITLSTLWQLLVLSFSWGILLTLFYFTNIFTHKNISPTKKFTLFMSTCIIVESLLVFAFGLFGVTSLLQWGMFIGIVFILYAISLAIFEIYKIKASKEYTKLLRNYQHGNTNE